MPGTEHASWCLAMEDEEEPEGEDSPELDRTELDRPELDRPELDRTDSHQY